MQCSVRPAVQEAADALKQAQSQLEPQKAAEPTLAHRLEVEPQPAPLQAQEQLSAHQLEAEHWLATLTVVVRSLIDATAQVEVRLRVKRPAEGIPRVPGQRVHQTQVTVVAGSG